MHLKLLGLIIFASSIMAHAQTSNDVANESWEKRYEMQLRYLEGVSAPEFEAEDINGNPVKLSDFVGKTIVIDFWFTTCAPCLSAMPDYNSAALFFKDSSNVVFLSICIEKSHAKKQWKKLAFHKIPESVNLFLDAEKLVYNNKFYFDSVNSYPLYMIIGPNGKILGAAESPRELISFTYTTFMASKGVSVFDSYKKYNGNSTWINQNIDFFSIHDAGLRNAIKKQKHKNKL